MNIILEASGPAMSGAIRPPLKPKRPERTVNFKMQIVDATKIHPNHRSFVETMMEKGSKGFIVIFRGAEEASEIDLLADAVSECLNEFGTSYNAVHLKGAIAFSLGGLGRYSLGVNEYHKAEPDVYALIAP